MKHTPKSRHMRTSKRGIKFPAGRGVKKVRKSYGMEVFNKGGVIADAMVNPERYKEASPEEIMDVIREAKDYRRQLSASKDYPKTRRVAEKTIPEEILKVYREKQQDNITSFMKRNYGMEPLPVYQIKGKQYFLDKKLGEYRNVKNPNDKKDFDDVSLDDLEKPESRKNFGASPRWIQKANLKKGALSKQLGIAEKDNIPPSLLNKIIAAKAGDTIKNPTKSGKSRIKVTRKLERRAILARNLKNIGR